MVKTFLASRFDKVLQRKGLLGDKLREASLDTVCSAIANGHDTEKLLSTMNDSFTTAEALAAGKQLRVTDRTVMDYLKELAKNKLIKKIRQGEYQNLDKG